MRLRAITLFLLAAMAPAHGEDAPECFSKFTKFNVCAHAREVQKEFSASLPMQMNSNITLSMASAYGPRIAVTAIWRITKPELDSSLVAGGMTMAALALKMDMATANSVCSLPAVAAFVRLGGQIEYIYRTIDGFNVLSPRVTTCQSPRTNSP